MSFSGDSFLWILFNLPIIPIRYLKLYHSTFFGLGVLRPEGMLNHEDVVQQLTELTVSYDIGLGIRGDYPELMEVSFKVEKDSYEKSIAW